MGSITPGKCADIVFLEDLKEIRVTRTIIDGEIAAENGERAELNEEPAFPEHFYHSMHVGEIITEASFEIKAPEELVLNGTIKTRVIESLPGNTITKE